MYTLFYILPLILFIPIMVYFYYLFLRLLHLLKRDTHKKRIHVLCIILSICFVFPAVNLFGFWALIILHFFAFSFIFDVIYWLLKKKKKHHRITKIYQSSMIPLLCVLLVLGYGYTKMKDVSQKDYIVYTQKALQHNYRIAFLSDLHFANTMDKEQLNQYCQQISKTNPDIIILGGDIVDEKTTKQQMKQAFETLGNMQSQFGIYYVYGNHDRATYSSHPYFTKDELKQIVIDNHIHILQDDFVTINDDFVLIGREDRSQPRLSSQQLLENMNQDNFMLVVDHQPVDLKINDELGYDLQLSGHTHGGQIFPVGLMIDLLGFGEMNYGYRQYDHMQAIVSSGIAGWGYPIRTGSHSEYVIVDIMKK